jgi:hypothetical protein
LLIFALNIFKQNENNCRPRRSPRRDAYRSPPRDDARGGNLLFLSASDLLTDQIISISLAGASCVALPSARTFASAFARRSSLAHRLNTLSIHHRSLLLLLVFRRRRLNQQKFHF